MAEVKFGYKAIKPILAWHDEQEMLFNPGDEVPAGEWKGAAVEALIENGKLMRYATNVYAPGEAGGDALLQTTPTSQLPDDRDALVARIADLERLVATLAGDAPAEEEPTGPFPQPQSGGFFLLSDGTRVKGKAKALAAQAELDVAAEAA